jgi:hypothetical protein
MAKVLGETARYVTNQSIKKYQRQMLIIVLVSCSFFFGSGFFVSLSLTKQSYPLLTIFISIIAIAGAALLIRSTNRIAERLEKERINYRKGAIGEALVGYLLEGLPDDYVVINGLKPKPHSGDIDHIVVGPSGVYAIDTKNWKGVAAADGKGELLWNGKPPDKPAAKNLTRTIMSIKEKIRGLSASDLFIQGILAFPSARVEAKWGQTGHVDCVTDEKLADYILKNKKGKRLTKKAIDDISGALFALAKTDKDFASKEGSGVRS